MKKLKVKCLCNEPISKTLRIFKFTDEQIDKITDDALKGNIPAMLAILVHNQRLMNEKLLYLYRSEKEKDAEKMAT